MLLGFLLFEAQFIHVVSITFTALILTELLMVALTIRTWHGLMLLAELFSIVVYVTSLIVLQDYFGESINLHCILLGVIMFVSVSLEPCFSPCAKFFNSLCVLKFWARERVPDSRLLVCVGHVQGAMNLFSAFYNLAMTAIVSKFLSCFRR